VEKSDDVSELEESEGSGSVGCGEKRVTDTYLRLGRMEACWKMGYSWKLVQRLGSVGSKYPMLELGLVM
jgi:hypothetical protein